MNTQCYNLIKFETKLIHRYLTTHIITTMCAHMAKSFNEFFTGTPGILHEKNHTGIPTWIECLEVVFWVFGGGGRVSRQQLIYRHLNNSFSCVSCKECWGVSQNHQWKQSFGHPSASRTEVQQQHRLASQDRQVASAAASHWTLTMCQPLCEEFYMRYLIQVSKPLYKVGIILFLLSRLEVWGLEKLRNFPITT